MGSAAGVSDGIRTYWRGQGPLWKVFWLWGVVGSWILAGLFGAAWATLGMSWGLYTVTGVVMIAYTVWILVSVWRCARNSTTEHWGQIARFLTVAWALNIVLVGAFLGLDLLAITSA